MFELAAGMSNFSATAGGPPTIVAEPAFALLAGKVTGFFAFASAVDVTGAFVFAITELPGSFAFLFDDELPKTFVFVFLFADKAKDTFAFPDGASDIFVFEANPDEAFG